MAELTSKTITVEHVRIFSGQPFAQVRRKLEGGVVVTLNCFYHVFDEITLDNQ